MSIPALMPVYPRCDVRPVKGEHCHLIDEDGTRYLDFASGIAVNLLGHSHPHLTKAIQDQAGKLIHAQVNISYHEPMVNLTKKLVDVVPKGLDSFFFWNRYIGVEKLKN